MDKKHVLIFIPAIESGGVEKNAIIVANGLAEGGYPVTILYCRAMEQQLKKFDERVRLQAFPRKQIPHINPRLTDAYFMQKHLKEYLSTVDAKAAVLIAFQSASVAIGVCKRMGIRVICRLSNHPSAICYEKSMIRNLSEKLKLFTYKKADVIVANSKKLAEDFGAKVGRSVETIYNPVDIGSIQEKRKEPLEPEILQEADQYKGKLLVAVGRLTAQKDYDTLLQGFSRSKHRDTMLWIIGEGARRPQIEQLAKTLGIEERVRLLGYQSNVYKYLQYATIYVLTSLYEGCPNSLIEAVAAGIPCIASDCLTGPGEVLLNGEGGLLFPVGDADKLAECMDCFLDEPEYRSKLQEKAKENSNRFELEKTLDRYKQIIG